MGRGAQKAKELHAAHLWALCRDLDAQDNPQLPSLAASMRSCLARSHPNVNNHDSAEEYMSWVTAPVRLTGIGPFIGFMHVCRAVVRLQVSDVIRSGLV